VGHGSPEMVVLSCAVERQKALLRNEARCNEKWTKDGTKVDHMLYAGGKVDKAREVFAPAIKHRPRIRVTIQQRNQVLEQWPVSAR
jgi:hypothetical protein